VAMFISLVRWWVLTFRVPQALEACLFDLGGWSKQDSPETVPGQPPKCMRMPVWH